jgi:hypothetical protein
MTKIDLSFGLNSVGHQGACTFNGNSERSLKVGQNLAVAIDGLLTIKQVEEVSRHERCSPNKRELNLRLSAADSPNKVPTICGL